MWEEVVLGTWLNNKNQEDINIFTPADFSEKNQAIFRSIRKYGTKNLSKISTESKIPLKEIADLLVYNETLLYEQALNEHKEVKSKEYLNKNIGKKTVEELVQGLKEYLPTNDSLPIPDNVNAMTYLNDVGERATREVVDTGIKRLDNMLCGVKKKEITALAARPSVGKSAMMLQVALKLVSQGKKVLYFPLEMSVMQTLDRFVLQSVDIAPQKLRRGSLEDDDWQKLSVVIDQLETMQSEERFLIFESCNDIEVIEKLIRKYKPYAVFIDQLEQMRAKKRFKDKRERFSYMTNNLKRISMESDVAIWYACQVNRDAQNEIPTLANLKESGSIEEDSDNVILLHRYEQERSTREKIRLELAKQRGGQTGTVEMIYAAEKFKFYQVDSQK